MPRGGRRAGPRRRRESLLINVNSRLIWLPRNTGENVFAVQVGVGVSPKVRR